MNVTMLQRTYSDMFSSLMNEGVVNGQLKALYELQDEGHPRFVFQTVSLFFVDTEKLINDINSDMIQPIVDYNKIKELVHKLKGSNKCIGAQGIEDACLALRNYCDANVREGCLSSMQQLNKEFLNLKSRLGPLFMVEQQILAAGGSIPKIP